MSLEISCAGASPARSPAPERGLALVGAQVGSSGAGLPGWLAALPRILAGLMCWATALVAYLLHRAGLLRVRPAVAVAAYALSLAFALIGTWLLAEALF